MGAIFHPVPKSPEQGFFLNGDMQIHQMADSASGVTGGYHVFDRWDIDHAGATELDMVPSLDAPPDFPFSMKIDVSIADASLGSLDRVILRQKLEGQDLQLLKFGSANAHDVVAGFWVRSSTPGTYTVGFVNSNVGQRYIARTIEIEVANTWEFKTIAVPGDISGDIVDGTGTGFEFQLWLAAGSGYTSGTLADDWEVLTDANRVSSAQQNLFASTANDFYFTGAVLFPDFLRPFQHLRYQQSLQQCLRYFWSMPEPLFIAMGIAFSSTQVEFPIYFPVEMRVPPSVSVNLPSGAVQAAQSGVSDTFNTFVTFEGDSLYSVFAAAAVTGFVQGESYRIRNIVSWTPGTHYWRFDSEL